MIKKYGLVPSQQDVDLSHYLSDRHLSRQVIDYLRTHKEATSWQLREVLSSSDMQTSGYPERVRYTLGKLVNDGIIEIRPTSLDTLVGSTSLSKRQIIQYQQWLHAAGLVSSHSLLKTGSYPADEERILSALTPQQRALKTIPALLEEAIGQVMGAQQGAQFRGWYAERNRKMSIANKRVRVQHLKTQLLSRPSSSSEPLLGKTRGYYSALLSLYAQDPSQEKVKQVLNAKLAKDFCRKEKLNIPSAVELWAKLENRSLEDTLAQIIGATKLEVQESETYPQVYQRVSLQLHKVCAAVGSQVAAYMAQQSADIEQEIETSQKTIDRQRYQSRQGNLQIIKERYLSPKKKTLLQMAQELGVKSQAVHSREVAGLSYLRSHFKADHIRNAVLIH